MATTESSESFQIPIEAAEAYEAEFVPAFFGQWAPLACDAAGVRVGQRLLDVACGTGIVARIAADRIGEENVVGVDLNEAMLTVARRVRPAIDWRHGDAASLPFDDNTFDVVVCQMALMFFADPVAALGEMARVAIPGGIVAVVVPSELDAQPAYGPFVAMAVRHAGSEAESLLSTYFACGRVDELTASFDAAGLAESDAVTKVGAARFPSVDALVATEVDSTPLQERISAGVYDRIRDGARDVLAPFVTVDGHLEAPFVVHIVTARRPT